MNKFNACIIKADGTNCERETDYILRKVGFNSKIIHIYDLLNHIEDINRYNLMVFPGGFSYGDYTGSGRLVMSVIKNRLKNDLAKFVFDGKLILGICNGFQILVKSGILPNSDRTFKQEASLIFNDSHKYEDRWVKLSVKNNCAFTKNMDDYVDLPVAHGEGKFVYDANDDDMSKYVVLKYVDAGNSPTQTYPANPNGSQNAIAGITDATGRVLGLMPHPERFIRSEQHYTGEFKNRMPHGILFFENAFNFIKEEL